MFLYLGYSSSNQTWPRKIDSNGWEEKNEEKKNVGWRRTWINERTALEQAPVVTAPSVSIFKSNETRFALLRAMQPNSKIETQNSNPDKNYA